MERHLMINNKINVFLSVFLKMILKLKYRNRIHIGKRLKAAGSTIAITNKNGVLKISDSFKVMKNAVIHSDGGKIEIGNNVFVNSNSIIVSRNRIGIGNNVCIGPNVCVYDHNHLDDRVKECGEIFIEDGVWIGAGVIILKGVRIGKNAIIGAGSVITKNVDANVIIYQKRESIIKRLA